MVTNYPDPLEAAHAAEAADDAAPVDELDPEAAADPDYGPPTDDFDGSTADEAGWPPADDQLDTEED